nr:hypothetical protein [Tanacetum cinerariifolium]
MKGLDECIASASNLRRIPVRDIAKKVEDYFKTYSSAKIDNMIRVNKIVTIFLIESLIRLLDQNRYPVDTRLTHLESRKLPAAMLFDDDTGTISIFFVNTKEYHSDVLAES